VGVPERRGGFNSNMDEGRTLLDGLYADPTIRKVLARYRVVVPETWTPTGPFEALAPLPLDDRTVRALYEDVGLPVFHMTLLMGVGLGAVRGALTMAGVALRAASEPAPWTASAAGAARYRWQKTTCQDALDDVQWPWSRAAEGPYVGSNPFRPEVTRDRSRGLVRAEARISAIEGARSVPGAGVPGLLASLLYSAARGRAGRSSPCSSPFCRAPSVPHLMANDAK